MSKNKKFRVKVEKRLYCKGTVDVSAKNADAAIDRVRKNIESGKLQTTAVKWDDPQYEDCSFDVAEFEGNWWKEA